MKSKRQQKSEAFLRSKRSKPLSRKEAKTRSRYASAWSDHLSTFNR